MILPGQSRQASKRLNDTLSEVQAGLPRRIIFLPLGQHRDHRLKDNLYGYHDSDDGIERVWVYDSLPYAVQEAVAAHELAHVLHDKTGYPRVLSIRGHDGQPLSDSLERLAARINNLVMDESADLWAISRGFDLEKVFGYLDLDVLISGISSLPAEKEAADWEAYYGALAEAALEHGRDGSTGGNITVGAEASTQTMALDYAGLSLRLGRYGLFGKLEKLWIERWPLSRSLGIELTSIVRHNGTATPQECRRAFEDIIAFLKIPPPLIGIFPAPRKQRDIPKQ